jgi:hypothetical protein
VLGKEIIGLRGYQDNQITPPSYIAGNSQSQTGGVVYEKLGIELRYPVTTGNAATIYGLGIPGGLVTTGAIIRTSIRLKCINRPGLAPGYLCLPSA